jgi:hypothetical protein
MVQEKVSLRQSALWGAVAFGVALAVVIGVRLDQAALAVVVGVACGVGASIPISLLIISVLRRRDASEDRRAPRNTTYGAAQSPPVVLVAPPTAAQLPQPSSWSGSLVTPLPAQRQFKVIGEEGVEDGIDEW